jgi:hypothetical protein
MWGLLCVRPAQLIASVCGLPSLLRVCAACPAYCQCVRPVHLIASVCGLSNLLRVCAACPTYCECVRPAQLIASVCGLPNLMPVCAACPTYCQCVRPAQLPVLPEVRAPSLPEQHPRCVPHWDCAGYNSSTAVAQPTICHYSCILYRRSTCISVHNTCRSDSHYNILPLQDLHSPKCCMV